MKTLLWGFWGGLNVGDELILSALLDIIGRDNVVVVARGDSKWVEQVHSVESISYIKAVHEVPLRRNIVGGGGLFQDTTSVHNILYYLYPVVAGWKAGLLGIGIGPLYKKISLTLVKHALRGISFAVVRDSISHKFLKNYVRVSKAVMLPDLVFTTSTPYVEHGDYDVFIPGPATRRYRSFVEGHVEEPVVVVEFFPKVDSQFRDVYPGHWEIINGIEALKSGDLLPILASSRKLIVGRYHGMILACLMKKTFIPMYYDPKMVLIMKDFCGHRGIDGRYYVNIDSTIVDEVRNRAVYGYHMVKQYLVGEGWV